jgi:hypothetical protein
VTSVDQSAVEDADGVELDVDAESPLPAGFVSAAGAVFESAAAPSPDSFVTDSFDDPASSAGFDDALIAEPRSFFAQPVPLKWIAGAVKPFVIVPSAPHSGQNRGPWSFIPWITSVRWRQAEHV